MIWPLQIAPYAAIIVQMKVGDEAQDTLCQKLHDELTAKGIDVLWDDRKKVRPGAKFKDADLIGIPMCLVVGRDAIGRVIAACEDAGRKGRKKAASNCLFDAAFAFRVQAWPARCLPFAFTV